jgi:hypothetical protein
MLLQVARLLLLLLVLVLPAEQFDLSGWQLHLREEQRSRRKHKRQSNRACMMCRKANESKVIKDVYVLTTPPPCLSHCHSLNAASCHFSHGVLSRLLGAANIQHSKLHLHATTLDQFVW